VTFLDASQQQVWAAWSAEHPDMRGPGQPADDKQGPLQSEVVDVVLAALEAHRTQMEGLRRDPTLSEDDVSDLDNDISHVRAVERAVYASLQPNRAIA